MAFDKKVYWENRKKGIRGQGEIEKPTFTGIEGSYMVRLRSGWQKVGRKVARKMGMKDAKV